MSTLFPNSKIVGAQYVALSSEEWRKMGTTEVTKADTSDRNGVRENTLLDPAMGCTSGHNTVCKTCENISCMCVGHFGITELSEPVFNPTYLNAVMMVLRYVCHSCACVNANIPPAECNRILSLKSSNARLACTKKHCKTDLCVHCKEPQLRWKTKKKDGLVLLHGDRHVQAKEILELFERISTVDARLLGFEETGTQPANMLIKVMPIPPNSIRPQIIKESGARGENELTHRYSDALREATRLGEDKDTGKGVTTGRMNALQYFTAVCNDSTMPCPKNVTPHVRKASKGLRNRLESKDGDVRGRCMGKRVDFSARSVITPDPSLLPDEVAVPIQIVENQFFPMTVCNERVRRHLQKLVDQVGQERVHGARHLHKWPENRHIDLKVCGGKVKKHLQIGDVVDVCIDEDSCVQFNRQPTLHNLGIMGHRVRPWTNKTLGMNDATATAYNADHDGDEMNIHTPQSEEAHAEITCMNPSAHTVSIITSTPVIYPVQDTILGTWSLFSELTDLTVENASHLIASIQDTTPLVSNHHVSEFKLGTQVFSLILPEVFNFEWDDPWMRVVGGQVQPGSSIDKSSLCSGAGSLVHKIFMLFGPKTVELFCFNAQKLAAATLQIRVASFGPETIKQPQHLRDLGRDIMAEAEEEVKNLVERSRANDLVLLPGLDRPQTLEFMINEALNKFIDKAAERAGVLLDEGNTFRRIIEAKSRASKVNITQTMIGLFQQNIGGKRLKQGFTGRVMCDGPKFDCNPKNRGFVSQGYAQGLNPKQFSQHCMAGISGLISTSVGTSDIGYTQRRLMTGMEGIKVNENLAVTDSGGRVIQFSYGGNSFHPARETLQPLWCVTTSKGELIKKVLSPLPKRERKLLGSGSEPEGPEDVIAWELKTLMDGRKWLQNCSPPCVKLQSAVNIPWIIDALEEGPEPQNIDFALENAGYRQAFFEHINELLPPDPAQHENDAKCGFEILVVQNTCWAKVRKLSRHSLHTLWEKIMEEFNMSVCEPGSMVGNWSASSVGKPCTHMTLNTFHAAGNRAGSMNGGINKMKEIINVAKTTMCPTLCIFLKLGWFDNLEKVQEAKSLIECVMLKDICGHSEIIVGLLEKDVEWVTLWELMNDVQNVKSESENQCVARICINSSSLTKLDKCVDDVCAAVRDQTPNVRAVGIDSHPNEPDSAVILVWEEGANSDQASKMEHIVLTKTMVSGVEGVRSVVAERRPITVADMELGVIDSKEFVLVAEGNNVLGVCALPFVDGRRTFTTDVHVMASTFGIEAAMESIDREMCNELAQHSLSINSKHTSMLSESMTYLGTVQSITRFGINHGKGGEIRSTIAKGAFEETCDMFAESAQHSIKDVIGGNITDAVFFGRKIRAGTGFSDVIVNIDNIEKWCHDDNFGKEVLLWEGAPTLLPKGGWTELSRLTMPPPPPMGPPPARRSEVKAVPEDLLRFLDNFSSMQ